MIKHALLPLAAALVGGIAFAAPASAQTGGTLIIYGNDKCPVNTICVRAPETDRYRIPPSLRSGVLPPAKQPWSQQAKSLASVGASGTGSCSASGAGGWTGCWSQMMRDSKADQRQQQAVQAAEPLPK